MPVYLEVYKYSISESYFQALSIMALTQLTNCKVFEVEAD